MKVFCQAIREIEEHEFSVVVIAEQEDEADGIEDWVITDANARSANYGDG
jgi:hypothetical protein